MTRVLYRIVLTNPPTVADFLSNGAQGLQPRGVALRQPELWSGLLMFDTLERSRAQARRFPGLGQYIAAIRIPVDAAITARKTLGEGHYTVWGDPETLLAAVSDLCPV